MTHVKWRKGIPYLYKSVRVGKSVKSVYMRAYAQHLKNGGGYIPTTKKMTAKQIGMLMRIADNVHLYKELRKINQKPAFKPYSTTYYRKWKKEFSL